MPTVPRARNTASGDAIPGSPPASVLAEVRAAHRRMEALHELGMSVDFGHDPDTGGLAIALRSPRGARSLRPAEVFDLLDQPLQ